MAYNVNEITQRVPTSFFAKENSFYLYSMSLFPQHRSVTPGNLRSKTPAEQVPRPVSGTVGVTPLCSDPTNYGYIKIMHDISVIYNPREQLS